MENMKLYDAVRSVPENAKKTISAGRLKGMTDINPMWRIQALTQQFGPCGTGWKYVIREKRLDPGANGEIAAFVDIDLFYKVNGDWSAPIPGTGGATFVAKERNGMYTSDECFKMALTDALSVACKALGFGADVYWAGGRTKYQAQGDVQKQGDTKVQPSPAHTSAVCMDCKARIVTIKKKDGSDWPVAEIVKYSTGRFGRCLCPDCQRKALQNKKGESD